MTWRVVLLGFTLPGEWQAELFALDPAPAVQTHKFGWSLARGLRHGLETVRLLSTSPIQSFPIARRVVFRGFHFKRDGFEGRHIGFLNLLVLKHFTRAVGCIVCTPLVLRRWKANAVFIHGLHSPYLVYGLLLRALGLVIIPVLTDPPGLPLGTDGRIAIRLKLVDRWFVTSILKRFSGIIALSPNLVRDMPPSLPVLIVPGIVSAEWVSALKTARDIVASKRFSVMYAGGLNKAYGIPLLLEAARSLPHVEFNIFGIGDFADELRAAKFENVNYHGFVAQDELVPHVLGSDLLINTRPSKESFAMASFPSKLIEYLASGRPVLTTRMAAIPDDLSDAFHYIDDETPDGIAAAIRKISEMDPHERNARALEAKTRVLNLYSEMAFGEKVANFMKNFDRNR